MARARQYDSVCTDKGGREERECARHWIMQGEKVDGVTGRAGHRGERALSCPLQPFKDNKPQPPRCTDINSLHPYMCTRPVSHIRNAVTLLSHVRGEPPHCAVRRLMITRKILFFFFNL